MTGARGWKLPRLLLMGGVLYGLLLLLWYNRRVLPSVLSTPHSFRPKFGEIEVLPTTTKPVPTRKKKTLPRLILSPQGRAAVRQGEEKKQKELEARQNANSAANATETPEELAEKARREKQREADAHARTVKTFPTEDNKERQLHCIGWRETDECTPTGPRLPDKDLSCFTRVPSDSSGYCEVEDSDTGERFRVGKRHCDSLKHDAVFRCSDAVGIANFPRQSREAVRRFVESGRLLPNVGPTVSDPRDGIVMVVYPRVVASAYATIRVLRDVLGCLLPIEIWFVPHEMEPFPGALEILQDLTGNDGMGEIYFHEVTDPAAVGFRVKVHAIYNSMFERALYLDADNVPVRDPSFLFQSREFLETGAVFWPDYWHPSFSIFNVHSRSLLWEMLDVPFMDMFEQESGQLLVDRRQHATRLELVHFYAFHEPDYFDRLKLVHGDKDLFRLAWLHQHTSLYMIPTPPAVAGKVINESFCGMVMVQHDADGQVLFLHRNSNKLTGLARRPALDILEEAVQRAKDKLASKYPGGRQTPKFQEVQEARQEIAAIAGTPDEAPEADGFPDPVVMTHVLTFNSDSERYDYIIDTYNADPEFPKEQNCYGQRTLGSSPHFKVQEVANLSFSGIETHLRHYAMVAAQLRADKST